MKFALLIVASLMLASGCVNRYHQVTRFENRQKETECHYVDGKRHGLYTSWYRNGQKKGEGTYVNGKLTGRYTYWSPDGKNSSVAVFKNGYHWDGKATWWDDNGQKRSESTYKEGKLIEYKQWDWKGNLIRK